MTTYCVSGSRTLNDADFVERVLCEWFEWDDRIVVGDAKGVDTIVREAFQGEAGIEVVVFEADWEKYGNAAGPIRNEVMVKEADVVLAFWNGKSRGTKNAIMNALKYAKELHVYISP